MRLKDYLQSFENSHLRNIIAEEYTNDVWRDCVDELYNNNQIALVAFRDWAISLLDQDFTINEFKEKGWI